MAPPASPAKKTPAKKAAAPKAPAPNAGAAPAAKRALAEHLRAACGDRPLGETLDALLALAPRTETLRVHATDDAVAADVRHALLENYGVVALGRAANGYFGVVASKVGKTIDATPVAYADREGLVPEVAARNLPAFLSLWAFAPDFFSLEQDADEWEDLHDDYFEDPEPEDLALLAKVVALPDVDALDGGDDAARIVERAGPRALASTGKVATPTSEPPPAKAAPAKKAPAKKAPAKAAAKPAPGRDTQAEEFIRTTFEKHVGKADLLIDIESVEADDDNATVVIGVNAERAAAQLVVKHKAVDGPLRTMLREVREELFDKQVVLKFQCVSPGGAEGKRSLTLGLKHAGAHDLLADLGLG